MGGFTSAPTDLSIQRMKAVESLTETALGLLTENSCRNVAVKIDWDVKKVNGTEELVPVVNISFTE